MLAVVREVYPSAWAGEAPGKKLRAEQFRRCAGRRASPPPRAALLRAPRPPRRAVAPAAPGRRGSEARRACGAAPHPFASPPPPAPKPEFEEPFVLATTTPIQAHRSCRSCIRRLHAR